MTEEDRRLKNHILILFLKDLFSYYNYKIKAEYSTDDNDMNVIVVQEASGQKEVFFGTDNPLYNYFNIEIYGDGIKTNYEMANKINDLIGKTKYIDYRNYITDKQYETQKWQIIFKQYTNPRAIEYMDIRRVAYSSTYQLVINRVS